MILEPMFMYAVYFDGLRYLGKITSDEDVAQKMRTWRESYGNDPVTFIYSASAIYEATEE